jgi:hypothetical protein
MTSQQTITLNRPVVARPWYVPGETPKGWKMNKWASATFTGYCRTGFTDEIEEKKLCLLVSLGALPLLVSLANPTGGLTSFPSYPPPRFRDLGTKNEVNEQQLSTGYPFTASNANVLQCPQCPQCPHTSRGSPLNKISVSFDTFSPAVSAEPPIGRIRY